MGYAPLFARRWSRRTTLRTSLSAVALAASGAILGACGSDETPTATTGASRAATVAPTNAAPTPAAMPAVAATAPATGANATVPPVAATAQPTRITSAAPATGPAMGGFSPSPAPNVPDAYTKLPPPFPSVAAVPGRGKTVSAFLIGYNPPVPGRATNRCYWQELERRLGATWEPTVTPAASYVEKLATLVASGNLPDLTFLQLEYAPDHNRLMLQGAYTDLTPFLAGDALKTSPGSRRRCGGMWPARVASTACRRPTSSPRTR